MVIYIENDNSQGVRALHKLQELEERIKLQQTQQHKMYFYKREKSYKSQKEAEKLNELSKPKIENKEVDQKSNLILPLTQKKQE